MDYLKAGLVSESIQDILYVKIADSSLALAFWIDEVTNSSLFKSFRLVDSKTVGNVAVPYVPQYHIA